MAEHDKAPPPEALQQPSGHRPSKIESLCTSRKSISSEYAKDPSKSPGEIAEELYGSPSTSSHVYNGPEVRKQPSTEDLARAKRCGQFQGTEPSPLFLHAYYDMLQCLEHDTLSNCVSPSLCGSTGYVPLTIIAPLNDQMRHMSNLIANAKSEVLLATNFWKSSGASTFINDALRELSKRAGLRGEKAVCKIIYDRGNLHQVFDCHQAVPEATWTSNEVNLPAQREIPNIALEVVNYHRPPLGTFHSKFMIVDRRVGTISSNNVQDNDNLEMMTHVEGPIVDSLWETFIVSWHKVMTPPLPFGNVSASASSPPSYQELKSTYNEFFDHDGLLLHPAQLPMQELPEHAPTDPHYDNCIKAEITRMRSVLSPKNGETPIAAVTRHLNKPTGLDILATAPEQQDTQFFPFIPVPSFELVPVAMCSRRPYPNLNNDDSFVPQNEAWLSLIRNAKETVFIQTPDLNSKILLPALVEACKRGIQVTCYICLGYNDLGELLPGQGGTNEMSGKYLYSLLSTPAERERLQIYFYTAVDQSQPIHNNYKQRSCHIKLLIADGSVGVQGSGNQDTQSWFHSQEVNIMVDSKTVCRGWREGIERNQNTRRFGKAAEDGCWYDGDGKLAQGSYGSQPSWTDRAGGVIGILNKARGK